MAQRHTTTCASCFTEIEYGAVCNCTDFNEVNDQYADSEYAPFELDDEDSDEAYLRDDDYYAGYDY